MQGPLFGLVLLCIIFSCTTSVFLSVRNALNILDQVTVLGILAIGMTAVIVIGGIDLSVGSVLALAMMIMGWLRDTWGVPIPIGIVIALLVGTACGLANGLLVTKAKLPAFIATLTMMSVGLADWPTSLPTVVKLLAFRIGSLRSPRFGTSASFL